ncbi:MAG: rRNA pseudouridine synthase [Pseudomonadota bacterium]|nr:rRNA pseudouridine synthase [Pseudomonadota bacterium]MDP1573173.1 rRNA pseudouridine synthase [Pseudomonadota bacterium]MDP1904248.1 rRNA pseudouridine synthase [Pseudomonadota bacterium]
MTDPIRLAKRVAELRACSRREAEQVIAGGWVRVDGVVVEEPQFRVADQQIDIDAQANPGQTEAVTLLLHKPPGYFTHQDSNGEPALQLLGADSLWSEDASGIRPLKMHFSRLTVCAPLETSASGLVVFTQDWRVARKLTESAATVEHEIVVEVAGELAGDGLKRLNQGITFNGRAPTAIKVSWQNESRLRVALKGAQPGQVAHMCEAVGLKVLALKRIRLGSMPLGKLPPGQWRYLRGDERF